MEKKIRIKTNRTRKTERYPGDEIEPRFLTVEKAAYYLGLTSNSLRKMIYRKQIPFHRILPRRILFDRAELDQWVKSTTSFNSVKDNEI